MQSRLTFSILWLLLLLLISTMPFLSDTNFLAHVLYSFLGLFSYIFCILTWLRSGNRAFSLFLVFVLYMLFSHLGQALLYSFGVSDIMLLLYDWCSATSVTQMLRFHMLCPAALNVGVVLYFVKHKKNISLSKQVSGYYENIKLDKSRRELVLDILLFATLLYALYSAVNFWKLRQTMSYAEFYDTLSGSGSLFKSMCITASVTIGLVYVYKCRYQKFIYASWLLIALIYLIGGSRGTAIPYIGALLVAVPVTHSYFFDGNKKYIWLLLAFIAFSFLSVISSNRAGKVGSDALVSNQSILDNAIGTMAEMGGSALPTVLSMEACDSGVLPHYQSNVFFLLACFIPADLVEFITGIPNVQLARIITDYAGSTWSGLGYSCVAEVYVNYGWFGWLWFIFYGYLIVLLECSAYKFILQRKYFIASLFIYILSSSLFYARAPIYYVQGAARGCFYLWILFMIIRLYRTLKQSNYKS